MPRLFVATLALVAAVGPRVAAQKYIAATPETVFSETDERHSDPPVHTISVVNRSTVPVVVWNWALTGCENVRYQCTSRPSNIRVRPNQRVTIVRVEPAQRDRGFAYRFGFSWRADSAGTAALAVIAAAGDPSAQRTLDARRRADSISRAETGPRFRELTRDDFRALAGKSVSLRSFPDTVVMKPGSSIAIEGIRVLVVDSTGNVLGRTGWVRWRTPGLGPVMYSPATSSLTARHPGRSAVRFELAEEAQQTIGQEVAQLEVPVVVRYTPVPDAPVFLGLALDADTRKPLACARVALEDSAQNVIAQVRSGRDGSFMLHPPIPGTYAVRVDAHGWAPIRGPAIHASVGEEKQSEYLVKFTDQLLMARSFSIATEVEPPRPISLRVEPVSARRAGTAPIVQSVTLGGSESLPILGIVTTRVPPSTIWMQLSVDSAGAPIDGSLLVPAGAPATTTQAAWSALERMRFAPAKDNGRPVCELMRMQVNFSPR